MSYIGLMMSACGVCGEVARPVEEPREEPLPGGGVRVYGTLCVCACDPRWPGREPVARWEREPDGD